MRCFDSAPCAVLFSVFKCSSFRRLWRAACNCLLTIACAAQPRSPGAVGLLLSEKQPDKSLFLPPLPYHGTSTVRWTGGEGHTRSKGRSALPVGVDAALQTEGRGSLVISPRGRREGRQPTRHHRRGRSWRGPKVEGNSPTRGEPPPHLPHAAAAVAVTSGPYRTARPLARHTSLYYRSHMSMGIISHTRGRDTAGRVASAYVRPCVKLPY